MFSWHHHTVRTTIDLPDDLLRRAKATAALRGMKLKDLMAQILESGLGSVNTGTSPAPKRRKLPVMIPATGRKISILSNAELFEILDREDDKRHGRLT